MVKSWNSANPIKTVFRGSFLLVKFLESFQTKAKKGGFLIAYTFGGFYLESVFWGGLGVLGYPPPIYPPYLFPSKPKSHPIKKPPKKGVFLTLDFVLFNQLQNRFCLSLLILWLSTLKPFLCGLWFANRICPHLLP